MSSRAPAQMGWREAARSLSRVDACNPLLQAVRPGRGTNTKAAGFPPLSRPPPAAFFSPFALGLAPTHLGWGTRRQKRYAASFDFVSFSFSSFSLLQQRPGKGDTPKRILLREGTRLRASLLIRGSKAGPSEGFNGRLRARGPHTHYWSEVRRPAPRKGSTAASGHSGSAPTTDQGFEGWPSKGSQPPQTQSEG
jgi:hypothetical protein